MSEKETDVNWDEMDLGTDLGDGETAREVKDARYLLKCESMEIKIRKAKDGQPEPDPSDIKNRYLNVRFRIMDSVKEEFIGAAGESVFDIFNLGEEAIWKLKQWIKAALPTYTGSKIPKELEGTFVSAFVETKEYGGYENLRTKQFKPSTGWTGCNYIIDENGRMEMIGSGKKDKKSESKPAGGTPPKNGTNKPAAAKPASKPSSGDDEVEV